MTTGIDVKCNYYEMTTEETTKRNEEIAKFIGILPDWYLSDLLDYHYNWQSLMPVVDKIVLTPVNGFNSEFCIKYKRCDLIVYPTPFGCDANSTIEAVWNTVYEFCKWYNENKKTDENKN